MWTLLIQTSLQLIPPLSYATTSTRCTKRRSHPDPPAMMAASVQWLFVVTSRRSPALRWPSVLLISGGALVFSACGAGVVSSPSGSGTATITWQGGARGLGTPTPFSGTVGGQSVSGDAVAPQPTSSTAPIVISKWTGTYEGKPFDLAFTIGLSSLSGGSPTLTISGSYGTSKVRGSATSVGNSSEVSFSGTVGSHHVQGTITNIKRQGGKTTALARFSVS